MRHPAYLGETILALACCLAKIDAIAVVIMLATIVAVVLRARTEEGVFATASGECSAEYAAYRASVRYRIFPGVWLSHPALPSVTEICSDRNAKEKRGSVNPMGLPDRR